MNLFDILFIIFIVSCSLSCGFFVRLIIWSAKKKVGGGGYLVGSCKNSFVLLCISLSIVAVCIAVFFTVDNWEVYLNSIQYDDIFYAIVVLILFFIPTVFLKSLAPVFIGIYIIYCSVFSFLFIDSYNVVKEDTIIADNSEVIAISYKNLLPLPSEWVSESKNSDVLFEKTLERCKESPFLYNSICLISSLIILE